MTVLKSFLLFTFVLGFVNGSPIPQISEDMMKDVIPDDIRTFLNSLCVPTAKDFMDLLGKYMEGEQEQFHTISVDTFLKDMEENYTDLYKIVKPIKERYDERVAAMTPKAREYFKFHEANTAVLYKTRSKLIYAYFICHVLPKWNALNEEDKKSFGESYPKIAAVLNLEKIEEISQCNTHDAKHKADFFPPY